MTDYATNSLPVNDENIGASHGDFKAIGAAKLSASAKYIATLMLATGTRSALELRALSGLAKTTVYRVLAEIFESDIAQIFSAIPISPSSPAIPAGGTETSPDSPADGNDEQKTVPIVPLAGLISADALRAPASMTPGANNELPSEVLFEEEDSPLLRRPPSPKKTTGVRGTRLANDWQLPEDWRQWVLVNCPCSTPDAVRLQALMFANYWQALAGQKATKVDWQKTWRNWCLKVFASGPLRERRDATPSLTAKQLAGRAALAAIEAKIAGYNS